MSAKEPETDNAAFNKRVGMANIYAFRVALIALLVSIVLGVLGPIMSLPTVSKAVDSRIQGIAAWATAKWSLPWPIFLAMLFTCLWLGRLMARRLATVSDNSPSTEAVLLELAPPAEAEPPKAVPPEPTKLPDTDLLILRVLARASGWVNNSVVAQVTGIDAVGTQAGLIRLRKLGLALASGSVWKLSEAGTLYVDHHRQVVMRKD